MLPPLFYMVSPFPVSVPVQTGPACFCLAFLPTFFRSCKRRRKSSFRKSFLSLVWRSSSGVTAFLPFSFTGRKKGRTFSCLRTYLLAILLLLLGIELCRLVVFSFSESKSRLDATASIRIPDTVQKLDIYLLVADGYARSAELTQALASDNSAFEKARRS